MKQRLFEKPRNSDESCHSSFGNTFCIFDKQDNIANGFIIACGFHHFSFIRWHMKNSFEFICTSFHFDLQPNWLYWFSIIWFLKKIVRIIIIIIFFSRNFHYWKMLLFISVYNLHKSLIWIENLKIVTFWIIHIIYCSWSFEKFCSIWGNPVF